MTDISASQARKQFADLLRKASSGETFTIVREGYPVATLGPPGAFLQPSSNTNLGVAPNYRPTANTSVTKPETSQERYEREYAAERAKIK